MTIRPLFLAACLTVTGWAVGPVLVNDSQAQEAKKKVYSEEDVRKFYDKGKEEGREEGRKTGWWEGYWAGYRSAASGGGNQIFGGYGGAGNPGSTGQTAGGWMAPGGGAGGGMPGSTGRSSGNPWSGQGGGGPGTAGMGTPLAPGIPGSYGSYFPNAPQQGAWGQWAPGKQYPQAWNPPGQAGTTPPQWWQQGWGDNRHAYGWVYPKQPGVVSPQQPGAALPQRDTPAAGNLPRNMPGLGESLPNAGRDTTPTPGQQ